MKCKIKRVAGIWQHTAHLEDACLCVCVWQWQWQWQQGVAGWHHASRFTCPVEVDDRLLPLLPLPYFMSPVCGAACVIDMLTVNVIGGRGEAMWEGGRSLAFALHLTAVPHAEVVKPSHRPTPAPALTGATYVAAKRVKF